MARTDGPDGADQSGTTEQGGEPDQTDQIDRDLQQLTERVQRLEQRLDLDAASAPARAAAGESSGPGGDFWALEGLRARAGDGAGAVVFAGRAQTREGPVEWQYGQPVESLQELTDAELEQAAAGLAALGSPVRLRLLLAVLQGRTTTAQLGDLDDVGSSGQIYHHVRALTAAGWLRTVSRGTVAVPPERVVPAWVALSLAT